MPDLSYTCLRPALFQLDAERAHDVTLGFAEKISASKASCRLMTALYAPKKNAVLRTEVAGLTFDSPIGLAAGLDKNGVAIDFWSALGFGFVEVGTVTPENGQIGNDKPRLARHIPQNAIINRMGFNNRGSVALAGRLKQRRTSIPIGANIGKAKVTPLDQATGDYVKTMSDVWSCCDYITVNVSSPNTPGLRDLQAIDQLAELVTTLNSENQRLAKHHQKSCRPIFLKIAPDLADDDLVAVAQMALSTGLDAIIATNTTIDASVLGRELPFKGGISGDPLGQRALECTRILYGELKGKIPIIGVGGIRTPEDAYERILSGANLIQIYSGFVFEGPGIVRKLCDYLVSALHKDGFTSISEAVGARF